MAKIMEPQKPGNSPGPGPEVVEKQRVAKERAAQRVRSWTVQNQMRGVTGRVSAGAEGRIFDSANPLLHQSTAASTCWRGPRPRLGWVKRTVGLPESPSYSGHSPHTFMMSCHKAKHRYKQ